MSAAPAAPAKAELGSEDAVAAARNSANDEAATSPLGTSAPGTSGDAQQAVPGDGGAAAAAAAKPDAAEPALKPREDAPLPDATASAASAEGSSGMPPVSSAAAPRDAAKGGFSFGINLAKSVGGGFGGCGFGGLAGASNIPDATCAAHGSFDIPSAC